MTAHLVWKHAKRKKKDVAHLRLRFQGHKFFRSLKTTSKTTANEKLWRANETLRRLQQGDLTLQEDCTPDEVFYFILTGGKQIPVTRVAPGRLHQKSLP